MVPETKIAATPVKAKTKATVAVQANGLPVGVEILATGPAAKAITETPIIDIPTPPAAEAPKISHGRKRMIASTAPQTSKASPIKRRKPGRPKAGKLDVPRALSVAAPAEIPIVKPAPLPSAPKLVSSGNPNGSRQLSDLTPRRPATSVASTAAAPLSVGPVIDPPAPAPAASKPTPDQPKTHKGRVHRVGAPALHYRPVFAFTMRARLRGRLVAVALLGSASLAVISAYCVWLALTKGIGHLATSLAQAGPKLGVEVILLGLLYYIGRSLGQSALTYGIARESDQRPVSLSRQFGVAVNTFGRHFTIDLTFGLGSLALIAAGAGLFVGGGAAWPMDANLQIGLIFISYLAILYGLAALAISRGLARVNVTLSTHRARTAAKVGWQLFSHRLELIGPRCGAIALESLLALPLLALGVAAVVSAPTSLHLVVIAGAGLLAWVAGALIGVGSAAWWTMLYRQLVLTDRAGSAMALLSGRQPEDARRGPMAILVAATTLIVAVALALPWVQLAK